uniref:Integrase zinc-binding domain-containing protein n=1 Tax=Nicotiana tabacum TaxID=4097 RepID=A0A1S3X915_TOBAC|nr:PREDICTED: uncharacterized protein LOC107762410 [Nicotiana tabacum]
MDQQKIQAITEWSTSKDIQALRLFLGLCNFYRRCVKSYSLIAVPLTELLEKGKTRQFYTENGFLKVKGNRLYIPKGGDLRRTLLAECHDTLWAGHPGEEHTMALLRRAYYLPQMVDDIAQYVKTCLVCQKDKSDRLTQA